MWAVDHEPGHSHSCSCPLITLANFGKLLNRSRTLIPAWIKSDNFN